MVFWMFLWLVSTSELVNVVCRLQTVVLACLFVYFPLSFYAQLWQVGKRTRLASFVGYLDLASDIKSRKKCTT